MTETSEIYQAIHERSQAKREQNREQSAHFLTAAGIVFTSHNLGAHLVVAGRGLTVDFWPGTGRWIARNGEKGFGVKSLAKRVRPLVAECVEEG